MADLEIVRVPVLSDNYAWLIHDAASGETVAVDPGEAQPLFDAAASRGWTIGQVWTTHWHPDHTGGNAAMQAAGARITGPGAEAAKIPTLDVAVGEGDTVAIGDHVAAVMTVPGHTQGHIAFHLADDAAIFTGDTLFAMGCGRLFEGSAGDMFANMQRYAALSDDTVVYCGHEYTQSNGRYALVAEPDNQAIVERMREVDALRADGEATVPTTIGRERATNPFLRAASADELGARRHAKDNF
ncbi:hydroxyacylglutathione hydrolase [Sphingomonas oligophenolica]|uniref:Hydroxyacylglutathione hydrolase n=1 Tax=Sphingomonas oligophenolica TaxID=301154 RepID=A0A502CKB2_9SPHN|nr:hydroxyacylglutathione hydrolase [Sphingomonas oligophenolica]TPG13054.1 hydroxyacylglutathione hydrolase [Sphingomonas oligophenolica]